MALLDGLVFAIAGAAVLGIVAAVLGVAGAHVLRLEWVALQRAIQRVLRPLREDQLAQRGMRFGRFTRRRQLGYEARTLLVRLNPLTGHHADIWGVRPVPVSAAILANSDNVGIAVAEVYVDLEAPERESLTHTLVSAHLLLARRARMAVFTLAVIAAAVLAWVVPALDVRSWSSDLTFTLTGFVAALLGTAVVALPVVAWRCMRRDAHTVWQTPQSSAETPQEQEIKPKLGGPDRTVRALNLAGGGFDTIMQLGVAHALVTIQGRAPDMIVGVSAGAVHAAAIAEVLQAGEDDERAYYRSLHKPGQHKPAEDKLGEDETVSSERVAQLWNSLDDARREEVQSRRLAARIRALRKYIDAAQRAPEELLDALLPDAYQIDSSRPLRPLEQPRFPVAEREDRTHTMLARSGLVRLYNDVMGIPFTIGAITRLVRRWLGIRAAAEIPSRFSRWTTVFFEALRMWILIGRNLLVVTPVVRVVMRALFPVLHLFQNRGCTTAGSVIFRHTSPWKILPLLLSSFWFVVLLLLWVSITALPIALGVWIAELTSFWWVLAGPLAVLGAVAIMGSRFSFDKLTTFDMLGDAVTAFFLTLGLFALWGTILLAAALVATGSYLLIGVADPVDIIYGLVGYLLWPAGGAVIIALMLGISIATHPFTFVERFLNAYALRRSLFSNHGLRTFLIQLFDPDYYSKGEMDDMVADSLDNRARLKDTPATAQKRLISDYCAPTRLQPIEIGMAVANTSTANLEAVPQSHPVVDGILAATAASPWFQPHQIGKNLYVDGSTVANEPTRVLLEMLRDRVDPESGAVHVYNVSSFPVSSNGLGVEHPALQDEADPGDGSYVNLISVAFRALRLQRFRDATLEQRLTELFTRTIPDTPGHLKVQAAQGKPQSFFRIWGAPIELDDYENLNQRVLWSQKSQRRQAIAETIADGCRASLQVMIPEAIQTAAANSNTAPCARAVEHHFAAQRDSGVQAIRLPGTDNSPGPGLAEICRNCRLSRREDAPDRDKTQTLRLRNWERAGGAWPHERAGIDSVPRDKYFQRHDHPFTIDPKVVDMLKSLKGAWPRDAKPDGPVERPLTSLLFSGGVFRGVYQMGVLNGLNEINARPDVIAGASVGAITAAMAAKTFSLPRTERPARITRLAAVYLAIDRFVLTDRFANFVRDLTIRAAATRFSIRDADRFFRKYDYPKLNEFDRNARRVVAGIERLLYVNPFQLFELVEAIRNNDLKRAATHLRRYGQNYLDSMGVGAEVLSAEGLMDLIAEYVTDHDDRLTFEGLREQDDIQMLATITNLTKGQLEVVGEHPDRTHVLLREGLLASSAFPGVFRPRWSWEVFQQSGDPDQYIDGGVMDNLPIDAVAQFLWGASGDRAGLIQATPRTPHLMVAGSLEAQVRPYSAAIQRITMQQSWLALGRRTKQLKYNGKIDSYASAQKKLREIHNQLLNDHGSSEAIRRTQAMVPVALEVAAVKPEWLCGTFAFHPMLGFRRGRQAQSIAHGCATTLLTFGRYNAEHPEWIRDWKLENLPEASGWASAFSTRQKVEAGHCWLRPGHLCPFSLQGQQAFNTDLPATTSKEVASIYAACVQRKTHLQEV